MKKILAWLLVLCMLAANSAAALAEAPALHKNRVKELYSTEGMYTDDMGNVENYSFHVPQIDADTPNAGKINREIAKTFGQLVEYQFENMRDGLSLWSWECGWHAYWYGSQLFLLVSSEEEGGFTNYAAYGYDFENDRRVTNTMILSELGISEQTYMDNLREKVQLMFESMYGHLPERDKEMFGYDKMLEKTMSWLDMEQPMYIDGTGQIVTIVKIASIAGADWYYHLATPFAYG